MDEAAKPDRLHFLREQHGGALLEAFLGDPRNAPFRADILQGFRIDIIEEHGVSPDQDAVADTLFQRYRAADPTRTGACTQWLIRQAIAGDLPVEDLPKARDTLEAFQTYKRRLPAYQRDLGRHAYLGDVWLAVEPFVLENAATSGKDEERREREAARAESTILLEEDGWTVAIPKTERAACWWGRGTRWCTAAERNNMFTHYSQSGPLVVFVRPDGAKFQFHAPSDQFMDSADRYARPEDDLADIRATLEETQPGLATALTRPSWGFRLDLLKIPPSGWIEAVRDYGMPCEKILPRYRDEDVCRFVLDHLIRKETAGNSSRTRLRVRTAREFLQVYVPEALRTASFYKDLVVRHPPLMPHLPERFQTAEFCMEAIERNPDAVCWVPDSMIDDAMCRRAVEIDGRTLRHLPQWAITNEIALLAVSKAPEMLRYVQVYQQTKELALAAVQGNGAMLWSVSDALRDRDVCWAALQSIDQTPDGVQTVIRQTPSGVLDRHFFEHVERVIAQATVLPSMGQSDGEEPATEPSHTL